MQIVIDIPEELKNDFETENWTVLACAKMKNALHQSMPLPNGHGRLIDADELLKAMDTWDKFGYLPHDLIPLRSENGLNLIPYVHYDDMVTCVTNMSTIIEADKEAEDKDNG